MEITEINLYDLVLHILAGIGLGVVVIGCVIKGKTPHFNLICNATFKSILNLSLIHNKPIGNGAITCLNMSQAKARKKKGAEAANAVISILSQK